ncbi:uncharacterized protein TNCV_3986341 [Trichonephila clavipes]|nr:uncharacterized protein TNCV_3986341 [Trichonephila clavipes]
MQVYELFPSKHSRSLSNETGISNNFKWRMGMCCLTEVTIPRKYFTIHPDYNDYYSIETIENVEGTTLLPEFSIPLYNENYTDFVEGVNANVKKLVKDPPIKFSLTENKNKSETFLGIDYNSGKRK